MARYPMSDEIEIGPPGRAVFVGVEAGDLGEPIAAFVSDDGERFGLDAEAVEARCWVRDAAGHDTSEEKRAAGALRGEPTGGSLDW